MTDETRQFLQECQHRLTDPTLEDAMDAIMGDPESVDDPIPILEDLTELIGEHGGDHTVQDALYP